MIKNSLRFWCGLFWLATRGDDSSHSALFHLLDADRDGFVASTDLISSGLFASSQVEYFDTFYEQSGRFNYDTFMWLFRTTNVNLHEPANQGRCPLLSLVSASTLKVIEVDAETLMASQFVEQFVVPHKPLVIRRAMKDSPAFDKWQDDEYLLAEYGSLEFKVEPRIEARGHDYIQAGLTKKRLSLSQFITQKSDSYVVSVLPHVMGRDVLLPRAMNCITGNRRSQFLSLPLLPDSEDLSTFITPIMETGIWMSRGRTRSQFHYDKENSWNCMIRGSSSRPKRWLFLDTRKYGSHVPWVRGNYNVTNDLFNRGSDWLAVDVDNVDLSLHSWMIDAEFEYVEQRPGDCIYIPYSYLHYAQYDSEDTMQLNVMWMWLPEEKLSSQYSLACDSLRLPLSAADTLFYYSGKGSIPQGMEDPYLLRLELSAADGLSWNGAGLLNLISRVSRAPKAGSFFEVRLSCVSAVLALMLKKKSPLDVSQDLWLLLASCIDDGLVANFGQQYVPRPMTEIDWILRTARQAISDAKAFQSATSLSKTAVLETGVLDDQRADARMIF